MGMPIKLKRVCRHTDLFQVAAAALEDHSLYSTWEVALVSEYIEWVDKCLKHDRGTEKSQPRTDSQHLHNSYRFCFYLYCHFYHRSSADQHPLDLPYGLTPLYHQ